MMPGTAGTDFALALTCFAVALYTFYQVSEPRALKDTMRAGPSGNAAQGSRGNPAAFRV